MYTRGPYRYRDSNGWRLRVEIVDDSGNITGVSYPRYLMEQHLGRKLADDEEVHHKDGDPLNNELDNLEIKNGSEHRREHKTKYHDTVFKCIECGREFPVTGIQVRRFFSKQRNSTQTGPFCSRSCSGKYGQRKQCAGVAKLA